MHWFERRGIVNHVQCRVILPSSFRHAQPVSSLSIEWIFRRWGVSVVMDLDKMSSLLSSRSTYLRLPETVETSSINQLAERVWVVTSGLLRRHLRISALEAHRLHREPRLDIY